ncbi:SGNH hydrolase domain-containing protein [Demequina sp. SYSU T00192]|uniref:SGNH hydrolase domain-containing protein n=1 Tax=Demequina litoralis TaxID=3051660 RepID=A0ABT8G5N4_9MICO|nr:SGNH hydrolase domain-containing protein [Demequina sp. SYSU T00192]MDN4474440.1 SGNH hydrolase domain-containing protein [Demequina sp. SYSU T00192]
MRLTKLTSRPSLVITFAAALVGMTASLAPASGAAAGPAASTTSTAATAITTLATATTARICFGAKAMAHNSTCVTDTSKALSPRPSVASEDVPEIYSEECRSSPQEPEVKPCSFGKATGRVKVALIGDSHAANWFPAVKFVAEKHGWDLTVYFKASCPWNATAQTWGDSTSRESCAQWNTDVTATLLAAPPDLIITSALFGRQWESGDAGVQAAVDGYTASWQQLTDAGSTVLPIVDTPQMSGRAQRCILKSSPQTRNCGTPKTTALNDPPVIGLAARRVEGVSPVKLNRFFCTSTFCPYAIGSVTVYRDRGHLTATYMRTVGPYLNKRIPKEFYAPRFR